MNNYVKHSAIDYGGYDCFASQLSYLGCARSAKVTRIAATCCNGAQQREKKVGARHTHENLTREFFKNWQMSNNIHEPVVAEHTPLPEHGANPVPPGAITLPVHAFCCAPTAEMRTGRDK